MNTQNTKDLGELKNDVIDHLRQLIRDINSMDADNLEKIAVSLGTIGHPLSYIEVSNKFYTDDIRHFLPEGTPDYILLEALRNIEETLNDRSTYDLQETLLCSKEDMFRALVGNIIGTLEEKHDYTLVEDITFNEDNENFMLILSAVDTNKEAVTLLVKYKQGATYELLNIVEDFSKEELEQKLFDSTIKSEELELRLTFLIEE